jgi:hypothetical protein
MGIVGGLLERKDSTCALVLFQAGKRRRQRMDFEGDCSRTRQRITGKKAKKEGIFGELTHHV